jgi:hypothetical protein
MPSNIKKKFIGTAVFALILGTFVLVFGSPVLARFIDAGSTLNVDGVVVSVGASSLTLDTVGSSAFELDINSRTVLPTGLSLTDIFPGDVLSIIARQHSSGNPLAVVIRKRPGSTYGFPGSSVLVNRGVVVAKNATSFTMDPGAALVSFEVLASTRFVGTNFSLLTPGDVVQVIGNDSGSAFNAQTVILR